MAGKPKAGSSGSSSTTSTRNHHTADGSGSGSVNASNSGSSSGNYGSSTRSKPKQNRQGNQQSSTISSSSQMHLDSTMSGSQHSGTDSGSAGAGAQKQDSKSYLNARLDFSTLPAPTLRRYQRVYKLHYGKVRGGHREDLASAVSKHFANQVVNEVDAIAWFIYAARGRDNVLKLTQKPQV